MSFGRADSCGYAARWNGRGRWWRRAAGAAVWTLAGAMVAAQSSTTGEYHQKAKFISQIPNFIEWPESVFSSPQAPFLICVLGGSGFDTSLAQAIQRETFHNRKLDVRWVKKISEVRACQILFVSRSEAWRYKEVLEAGRNAEVLTVGETPEFLSVGGVICFSYEQGALQFEVNLGAATAAQLKISSRLLALARHVVNRPEAATG